MATTADEITRVQTFLDELTELTRRTGVVVWGCACHDSPALLVNHEEHRGQFDGTGWYVVDYRADADPDIQADRRFGCVRWRAGAQSATDALDLRPGLADAPAVLPVSRELP